MIIYHNYRLVRLVYVEDKNNESCLLDETNSTNNYSVYRGSWYSLLQNNQCKMNLHQLPREAEKLDQVIYLHQFKMYLFSLLVCCYFIICSSITLKM